MTTYLQEESGGPPRKYYKLTGLGAESYARDRRSIWNLRLLCSRSWRRREMTRDEFMDKLERELAARRVPELPYWCGVLHGLALLGLVPIIASKAQKVFARPFW